jgi:hypothetical protein
VSTRTAPENAALTSMSTILATSKQLSDHKSARGGLFKRLTRAHEVALQTTVYGVLCKLGRSHVHVSYVVRIGY